MCSCVSNEVSSKFAFSWLFLLFSLLDNTSNVGILRVYLVGDAVGIL